MHSTLEFLLHHGYAVLLGWVFAEQIGLPVPSLPLLLAAGALAGSGQLNFFACLAVSVFASVCADSIWYEMGRLRGIKVLQLLCKISLEPDSCVRKTEGLFSTQGARSLLVAKFFPGFSTVAPPLAGVFRGKVRAALLIGKDASAIAAALEGVCQTQILDSMEAAVAAAHGIAAPGDTVLLSPACASLDMFRDYGHRGDVFAAAVRALQSSPP